MRTLAGVKNSLRCKLQAEYNLNLPAWQAVISLVSNYYPTVKLNKSAGPQTVRNRHCLISRFVIKPDWAVRQLCPGFQE